MYSIKKQDLNKIIYYQTPKWLFDMLLENKLSLGAYKTYVLMYDRLKVSAKNNWHDNEGNVYIKYSYTQLMQDLKCASKTTVSNNLKDLEKLNLIKKVKCFSSSNVYYLNFYSSTEDCTSTTNCTSTINCTHSSTEDCTHSSTEVTYASNNNFNKNNLNNNNTAVSDVSQTVEKKEVIPSAVRQEIEMAIRSNNWNITIQKLLMLAEGDYMLVLQQIKHFGEKGLRYTIAAIKGKYEVNQEPVKTAEDEKKERFKEWEHSIQLIEHQYKNCKEKIRPEIYEWMGEFLKERGII